MIDERTLPAAGWYTDPGCASRLRWWDGNTWTANTAERPAATVPRASVGEPTSPADVAAPGRALRSAVPIELRYSGPIMIGLGVIALILGATS